MGRIVAFLYGVVSYDTECQKSCSVLSLDLQNKLKRNKKSYGCEVARVMKPDTVESSRRLTDG